ncbi:MAG: 2-amino-4-hydroxy-6-hydroxymethyldihydropteridine diphosphokinase [Ferruginibacter sp.]
MNTVYLLLGSNLGKPLKFLKTAEKEITSQVGQVIKKSHIYKTAAWGNKDQPDFYNQILIVETHLEAKPVLNTILEIETKLGRKRILKYEPRIIDIDILFFNNNTINTPELKVPHPLIQERRFVLVPLNELSPNLNHPIINKTIGELLDICTDKSDVERN